jgi:hypothetical protein
MENPWAALVVVGGLGGESSFVGDLQFASNLDSCTGYGREGRHPFINSFCAHYLECVLLDRESGKMETYRSLSQAELQSLIPPVFQPSISS